MCRCYSLTVLLFPGRSYLISGLKKWRGGEGVRAIRAVSFGQNVNRIFQIFSNTKLTEK